MTKLVFTMMNNYSICHESIVVKTALSHHENDVFERLMKINVELNEIPFFWLSHAK